MGHKNWHRNHHPLGRVVMSGETERKREQKRSKWRRARNKELRRERREERKRAEERMRAARDRIRQEDLARIEAVSEEYGEEAWRPCLSKMYFDDMEHAEWYARGSTEWFGVETSVYKCRYCDGWHLTTHPREGQAVEAV